MQRVLFRRQTADVDEQLSASAFNLDKLLAWEMISKRFGNTCTMTVLTLCRRLTLPETPRSAAGSDVSGRRSHRPKMYSGPENDRKYASNVKDESVSFVFCFSKRTFITLVVSFQNAFYQHRERKTCGGCNYFPFLQVVAPSLTIVILTKKDYVRSVDNASQFGTEECFDCVCLCGITVP